VTAAGASRSRRTAQRRSAADAPRAPRGSTATTAGPAPRGPWLETLRLALREFGPGDADDLYRLDRDPRVIRYIEGLKPATRDDAAATLRRIMRYYRLYPELGAWYATRRDTGRFIGWFSLKYAGRSPDIEIGYRLVPEAWGQGFATEGATALLNFGFDELGLHRIIGVTDRGNRASQKVLLKAGLEDRGWGHYYDCRLRLFAADNPHRAT
jgi:RimJ/RimL family protein N-acetyltransferase